MAFSDNTGRLRLVVQLDGGSRLRHRPEAFPGVPVVVLSGMALIADPLRWRPLRGSGLGRWQCRCAFARPLPVDDAFSLCVIGCPVGGRREGVAPVPVSVIHDCARCAFFVGIGYADAERRRVSLYCAFGARSRPRIGPAAAPRPPAAQLVAAT